MQTYTDLPIALLDGWTSRDRTHAPLQQVVYHYHNAEEWLEVTRGEITFYSLSGQSWPLGAGAVFRIPRGEVHRAEIGPGGVAYRMYLPIDVTPGLSMPLDDDELALLKTNLEFPEREDNTDGSAARFFEDHLSEHLAFCRVDGSVVGKDAFRGGFMFRGRSSAGTICVLNRAADAILLSTGVIVGAGTAEAKAFTNLRMFRREDGRWKCRVWVNFPSEDRSWLAADDHVQVRNRR
jgi:hypothetical protein